MFEFIIVDYISFCNENFVLSLFEKPDFGQAGKKKSWTGILFFPDSNIKQADRVIFMLVCSINGLCRPIEVTIPT